MAYRLRNPDLTCSYCGSPEEPRRDHVVASSIVTTGRRRFAHQWIVIACDECNRLLGDRPIFNVPDRAAYLLTKLRKRYGRLLNRSPWGEEEVEECGFGLRASLARDAARRAIVEGRLSHLRNVAAMPKNYLAKDHK